MGSADSASSSDSSPVSAMRPSHPEEDGHDFWDEEEPTRVRRPESSFPPPPPSERTQVASPVARRKTAHANATKSASTLPAFEPIERRALPFRAPEVERRTLDSEPPVSSSEPPVAGSEPPVSSSEPPVAGSPPVSGPTGEHASFSRSDPPVTNTPPHAQWAQRARVDPEALPSSLMPLESEAPSPPASVIAARRRASATVVFAVLMLAALAIVAVWLTRH